MDADKGRETPSFGHIIRQRRIELGLTQEELAERVGESVRQSDISRMERDYISLPRRERLEALADALDVTPGYLLMNSGWISERDASAFGGGASRDTHPYAPRAGSNGGSGAGPEARQPRPGATDDEVRGHVRRHPHSQDHSTRLSIASQDVLAANLELTRAIRTLTDESQQGRANGHDEEAATDARFDELEALNRQLLAVIDTLNIRNDDLAAQSRELIAAASSAESDRFQLSAVMDAVGDVVIVVDENQAIVLRSQSFADLAGVDGGSIVFQDEDGHPFEAGDSPLARVARGEHVSMTVTIVTPDGAVQAYEAIGRPSAVIGEHRFGVLTLRLPDENPRSPADR